VEATGRVLGRPHCATGCVRGRGKWEADGLFDLEKWSQNPARDERYLPALPTKGLFVLKPESRVHDDLSMLQMLQFYERHVRIIKREDPDAESVSSAKL